MKRVRSVVIFSLFLSCLATHASTAASGESTVSVKGAVRGKVHAILKPGSSCTFRLENHGKGRMSGLGRVEVDWVIPEVKLNLWNRTLTVANLEWSGTITTASGDQIFGRYSFPSDTLSFSWWGRVDFGAELEITGGTGQFANATGTAKSTGRGNVFLRRFRIKLEGEMSPSK